MKVDYTRPAYGTSGTYGIDSSSARPTSLTSQTTAGAPASDTLSISGDVELAERAMTAVTNAPDIRPEAVARGRELLKNGIDLDALADAMVSQMMDTGRIE